MAVVAAVRKGEEIRGRPEGAFVPRTRPHVCFVAPYAWPVLSRDPGIQIVGGAEVQQCMLARLFQRSGYRVSMVTLDHGQPDATQVDGITVYKAYQPEAGIRVLRFLHPRLTGLWRAMQRAGADVYYQRSSAMVTALVAEFCRREGRRSIYAGASDYDFVPGREQISLYRDRWLFHHGLRTVDRIVVQNQAQLDTCRQNYGREATLIPSCYENENVSRSASADLVLWCGSVHRYKQPELLLEIARRAPRRRFVIVGGPGIGDTGGAAYYESIRREAESLPNVQMTGFLPLHQVETWFDRARVLVNTSVYEGMPNTFLQAWARGIPTVATVDVGARLEGAEIYRSFSDPADAAAEIERLFRDRRYQAQRSARVLEYFERTHSSGEVLARYGRVLDSLMEEKK
jgi:glycosyltransferase involved in cell wall biosynthesis